MKTYDLVIIRSGTAAMRTRAAGWQVAVIDFRPFDGTCALRGCDPKKMLIRGAVAVDEAHRMREKGAEGALHINWPRLTGGWRLYYRGILAYRRAQAPKSPSCNGVRGS